MDAQEFIHSIKTVVIDNSIKGVEELLNKPPGRKPSQHLVELSDWFNQQTDDNKTMISKIVKESVEMSVFVFLCVLDGVTAIEIGPDKGKLLLYYEKNNNRKLLNSEETEYLHNLL